MHGFEDFSKELFPVGQDRKNLIAGNQKKIPEVIKSGEDGFSDRHYTWLDSPLEGAELMTFAGTFREVLPDGEGSMKKYIEQALAKRKGSAIGIEFGGRGSKVFEGFSQGFFKRSIGVTLIDHTKHNEELHRYRAIEDWLLNHEVIEKDIFSDDLYAYLEKSLQGEQVDLILERMAKGLETVPPEPYFVSKFLGIWYRMLREEGLLFAQVPVALNPVFEPWTRILQADYNGVLEIQSAIGSDDDGPDQPSVLRLRKLAGAPKELPLLDPRTVRRISKGA